MKADKGGIAMRLGRVASVTAIAAALVLGVSACSDPEPVEQTGPNGYELAGTINDVDVWVDQGEESGTLDVMLFDANDLQIGACIGAPRACLLGDVTTQPYVVLSAPAGTARADLGWYGAVSPMTPALEGLPADGVQIFVSAPPAGDPAALAWSVAGYDAAGAVLYQQ